MLICNIIFFAILQQKGGFKFEDSLQVVQWLEKEGIDLIEISGGN